MGLLAECLIKAPGLDLQKKLHPQVIAALTVDMS